MTHHREKIVPRLGGLVGALAGLLQMAHLSGNSRGHPIERCGQLPGFVGGLLQQGVGLPLFEISQRLGDASQPGGDEPGKKGRGDDSDGSHHER